MAKTPTNNRDWTSLPVLTEIVGELSPEIPTLTDEALSQHTPAPDVAPEIHEENDVLEMSAEEIAALLAPLLEQQLRETLSAQFEALWQETWRKTRASLPELIRTQLTVEPGSTGLSGSNEPALDIIPPCSPARSKT